MTRTRWLVLAVVAAGLALAAWPVYAHCGKCPASAGQMIKMMEEGKLSLARAVEIAEKHCNGRALAAYCELEDEGLEIEIICLATGKIKEVEIDAKTGKVTEMEDLPHLPAVEEEEGADDEEDEHGEKMSTAVPGAEIFRTVQAGCGSCIFHMPGVKGCKLAVKIDGKPYLVSGAAVDAHTSGLCSAEKQAEVRGKVQGEQFVATSFKLKP